MASDDRMRRLREMLEKQPGDAFLLYGLAMEHKKRDELAEALGMLDRAIAADPNYCYAYYQKGMVQEMQGQTAAACESYRRGVEVATRVGDAHARDELAGALAAAGGEGV